MPHLGGSLTVDEDAAPPRLIEIPGMVPSLKDAMPGCLFAPRCASASERCRVEVPTMQAFGAGHQAACWHPIDEPAPAPGVASTAVLGK
jgi:peptide/nickel transport system ATP-binding protein